MSITKEEHRELHKKFHNELDIFIADFIGSTGKLPSKTSLGEFMKWSYEQTKNAEEIKEKTND